MNITTKNVLYTTKIENTVQCIQYNERSILWAICQDLEGYLSTIFFNVDKFVDKMWFCVYKQKVIHTFFHKTVHKSKNCV